MNTFNKIVIAGLIISIGLGVTSCVMLVGLVAYEESIASDAQVATYIDKTMQAPEVMPKLNDSLCFYRAKREVMKTSRPGMFGADDSYLGFDLYRFFFPRAKFTDSLYNGFCIVVADLGKRGIIVENQDNVTLSLSAMGDTLRLWESSLNALVLDRPAYSDFSQDGLTLRTLIKSNKN